MSTHVLAVWSSFIGLYPSLPHFPGRRGDGGDQEDEPRAADRKEERREAPPPQYVASPRGPR